MDTTTVLNPIIGGALIGAAASLLLLFQGRIFGVSGILNGVITRPKGDTAWRVAIVLGLLASGMIAKTWMPETLEGTTNLPLIWYIVAGLLVGFGTQLGSGCTSGHGVCGISRLSPRSLIATGVFITSGVLIVALLKYLGGAAS